MTANPQSHNLAQTNPRPNRRSFVASAGLLSGAAGLAALPAAGSRIEAAEPPPAVADLKYCLNMSTLKIGKLPIREQLRIAAAAGYDSVELWLRDIEKFVADGGQLSDLRKEIEDLGLVVDSAIAFGNWVVDDDAKRKAGLEQCRRDMHTLKQIGGLRIAAPPSGATREPGLDLAKAGQRYKALLEVGREEGIVPQVELWGFSPNLSTLAEVLYVAAAANDPDACILLDVYHLYKGGNDFENLGLVPGQQMHCLHMNDYPAEPPRATIKDSDRVYPGDGVAPMTKILRTLVAGGFSGTLSLELFNEQYWSQPAADVAATGLAKMKASVAKAFG